MTHFFNEFGRLIASVFKQSPAPQPVLTHFFDERGRLIASVFA